MGLTCPEPHAAGFLAGEPNAPRGDADPFSCAWRVFTTSEQQTDADRFHSDVSGEELALRQSKYERKQQIYDNTRQQRAEREEDRWRRIEVAKQEEEDYWNNIREHGQKVVPRSELSSHRVT